MDFQIKELKIALAGSGGSGKTTLMESWARKYEVPIARIETKSMMPDGISSHMDIIKLATHSPQDGIKFQESLIRARTDLFCGATTGLISDRSVVDSYAYYSIHNSMFADADLNRELYRLTADSVNATDITVILAPDLAKLGGVPENGVRLSSIPYYHAISAVITDTLIGIVSNDIIASTMLQINDLVAVQVMVSSNTAIAMIYEQNNPNGIASTEDRILAIEAAAKFVRESRTQPE